MIEFKLRQALAKKNKTMADVNKETGISKNALSQLANGTSKGIQFSTLDKILGCLKVPIQDLIVYTPESLSYVTFSFNYDETKPLEVSTFEDLYGTSDDDAIEYTSEINFELPDFRATANLGKVTISIPADIYISYEIDHQKHLSGLDVTLSKKESINELVTPSIFSGDSFEDALIEYIIDLSTAFPDDIEEIGNFSIYLKNQSKE
uniref:helix-turn-helix domain-containing protein n=1 Tax=Enterococcus faecalis TaxID=1351 RepID=UPI00359C6E65